MSTGKCGVVVVLCVFGGGFVSDACVYLLSDSLIGSNNRGKDVDHRNLISLTGSPADSSGSVAPKKKSNNGWGAEKDKVIAEKWCLCFNFDNGCLFVT